MSQDVLLDAMGKEAEMLQKEHKKTEEAKTKLEVCRVPLLSHTTHCCHNMHSDSLQHGRLRQCG